MIKTFSSYSGSKTNFCRLNPNPESKEDVREKCEVFVKDIFVACDKRSPQPSLDLVGGTLLTVLQDFSRSVHILGIPVFFRLICLVSGHEGPGVEIKVRVISR